MKQLQTLTLALGMIFTGLFLSSCDKCKDVNCENDGTCNKGLCECPPAFEGVHCEVVLAENFPGLFEIQKTCGGGQPGNLVVQLALNEDDKSALFFTEQFVNDTVTVKVTGPTTFTIPSQAYGSWTMTGSGSVIGNDFDMTYTLTSPGTDLTCTYVGTRQ